MKINIELDISPEELREVMGLPEIKGLQAAMLGPLSERLQDSLGQQGDAFAQTLLSGAMEPWKVLAKMMSGAKD